MQPQQMQIPPPQHNRQISPMNPRATPQPPQPASIVQPIYYTPTRTPLKPGGAPPAAKRLKPTPPGNHGPAAAAAQAAALGVDPGMTIDEEEDTSRGDMLDHLSPREIATTRYVQHHEWMEEVMGSPYAIDKIRPVSLGLGLRGELESVTKGLLDLPTYSPPPKPRMGEAPSEEEERDQGKVLEELRPRIENKIKEMEDEIARMQVAHAKRLQKIKQSGITKDAELKLRVGLGIWSHQQQNGDADNPPTSAGPREAEEKKPAETVVVKDLRAVEEIVREVEQALGKVAVEKRMLIKHHLPVGEIIKMGGVVAEGDGQPNVDTVMGEDPSGDDNDDDDNDNDGEERDIMAVTTVEDEFNLTLGTLPDEPATDTPEHQSELGFPQSLPVTDDVPRQPLQPTTTAAAEEEDTIMNDFTNVGQESKPDTPTASFGSGGGERSGGGGSGGGGDVDEGAASALAPAQMEEGGMDGGNGFRFSPPTEKVEDGNRIPGLGGLGDVS